MPPKRNRTDEPAGDVDQDLDGGTGALDGTPVESEPVDAPDPEAAATAPNVIDETHVHATSDLAAALEDLAPPEPPPLVRCRWLAPDPVLVKDPTARLVRYGEEVFLTEEQAADPRTPAVPWDDDWTPDPELAALAAGYDQQED